MKRLPGGKVRRGPCGYAPRPRETPASAALRIAMFDARGSARPNLKRSPRAFAAARTGSNARGDLKPSWKLSGGQFQVATGGAQSGAGRAAARHAPRETPTSADRRRTRLRAQVSDRPALTFIFSQISPPEAPRTPQAPRPPALHPRRTASTRALYPRVPYSTASRHRARADIPPPTGEQGPRDHPFIGCRGSGQTQGNLRHLSASPGTSNPRGGAAIYHALCHNALKGSDKTD